MADGERWTVDGVRAMTLGRGLVLLPTFFFLLFLTAGCESTIPGLSSAERKVTDSLYRNEMKIFRPEMDSFCVVLKDSLLPIYIDSMEKTRLAEIEKQLERIRNMK